MGLKSITKEERDRIINIFLEEDLRNYSEYENKDDNIDYFVFKLDDDCHDQFYDHSVPLAKIFKELQCVCTGFHYDNEYYQKGDVNTYYGMWFNKLMGS